MKYRPKLIHFILLILLTAPIAVAFVRTAVRHDRFVKKQEELAQEIGALEEDYRSTSSFPINYFVKILKPGMSKDEVHSIVIGYQQVFTCNEKSRELYYYFSLDNKDAVRFVVFYDFQYKFDKLQGASYDDDPNLVIVDKNTCIPGLAE